MGLKLALRRNGIVALGVSTIVCKCKLLSHSSSGAVVDLWLLLVYANALLGLYVSFVFTQILNLNYVYKVSTREISFGTGVRKSQHVPYSILSVFSSHVGRKAPYNNPTNQKVWVPLCFSHLQSMAHIFHARETLLRKWIIMTHKYWNSRVRLRWRR